MTCRFLVASVTGALLLWLGYAIDVRAIFSALGRLPFLSVVAVFVLLAVNLGVVASRFWVVLGHFGVPLPWWAALKASAAGWLAALVAIPLIGQVIGRHAILNRYGISGVSNSAIAAYERIVVAIPGMTAALLSAVYLMGSVYVIQFTNSTAIGEILTLAIVGAGVSLCVFGNTREKNLFLQFATHTNVMRFMLISAFALAAQILVLTSFVIAFKAVAPEMTYVELYAVSAIVSFAASMPLSFGGWGVRELVAVALLSKFGVLAQDAMAGALLIGGISTLVILVAVPFIAKIRDPEVMQRGTVRLANVNKFGLESASSWLLAFAISILIYFQVHVELSGGVANINLADPFAMFALVALALHFWLLRIPPSWKIEHFNRLLLLATIILVTGFAIGWSRFGLTQWALGSRIIGWLVLLGYLSAGSLVVVLNGFHAARRLLETLGIVACIIIIFQIVARLAHKWEIDIVQITPNFEGYAGNRNAFAFQLLTVAAALLAYSAVYRMHRNFLVCTLSLLFSGLVFTASRAGMGTMAILILFSMFIPHGERRVYLASVAGTAAVLLIVWLIPTVGLVGSQGVLLSAISSEYSNDLRWTSDLDALRMWWSAPFFGAGLGAFIFQSTGIYGFSMIIHSTPLWILAEFGLMGGIGGAYVAWILWKHYKNGTKPRWSNSNRALLFLIVVFFVFSQIHEVLYQRMLWFVLGLLIAQPTQISKPTVSPPLEAWKLEQEKSSNA